MTSGTDWSGRVGDIWAEEHARTEHAFFGIAAALDTAMAAVAPWTGHAADLGCGVGGTTQALAAARPALRITGIDLSSALIAVARRRVGERVDAPAFLIGDVLQVVPALAPLDLLVSRHGLMFFADSALAFATLRGAAAPGAPLVFSCFAARADNEWVAAPEETLGLSPPVPAGYAPGPFAFSDEAFTRALLHQSGWTDVQIIREHVDYPVGIGAHPVDDAMAYYRRIGPLASVLATDQQSDGKKHEAKLRELLARRIRDGVVTFSAAIWIITARAGKEAA